MKNSKNYSFNSVVAYFIHYNYAPVPTNDDSIVFFNKRKGQYLKISTEQSSFSKQDLISLLGEYNEAIDLPPKLEWYRYRIFHYKN